MSGKVSSFLQYNIATLFGLGNSPVASGTLGSAVAAAYVHFFWPESLLSQLALVIVVSIIGIKTSHWMTNATDLSDPHNVIIDEVAGQFLVFLFIPPSKINFLVLITGFLLFRFFDIAKPGIIRKAEALPGGFGVMADDLLAGLAAAILLRIGMAIF